MSTSAVMTPAPAAWRPEIRAMLALAWPLMLTNLGQLLIATTELVILGHMHPDALAAGSLGAMVAHAFFALGFGLAAATAPMMAQAVGARRHTLRELRRTVRKGLWLCALLGVPTILLLSQAEAFLLLAGQQPKLAADAGLYLMGYAWALPPAWGFMVLRSLLAVRERPKAAMVISIIALILNAFICYGLVFGAFGLPRLGILGAGIAGASANWLSFLMLLGFVLVERRFRRHAILGRWWRADWARLGELIRIGLPMSAAMLMETCVFGGAGLLMGTISTASVAAHAIVMQVASLTFMVPLGIAQAATVRVGIAAGRRDRAGVGLAGWTAQGISAVFMGSMGLVLWLAPVLLIGLFLDLSDPATWEAARIATGFLALAALFQLGDGAQVVAAGALRGLKDTRVPMVLTGIGYWGLGFPAAAALGLWAGLDGFGIWIGLAGAIMVLACLMLHRWSRREQLGLV
ncbi:MATE family efflux transporter [Zavarzinia sp. CC-PAN008]|uniref:MATE family efflux transporter n=1 Tax=Zavarzinia sp. CC-PAN008 TaxID=3243332 RepID=UPI003F74638F